MNINQLKTSAATRFKKGSKYSIKNMLFHLYAKKISGHTLAEKETFSASSADRTTAPIRVQRSMSSWAVRLNGSWSESDRKVQ